MFIPIFALRPMGLPLLVSLVVLGRGPRSSALWCCYPGEAIPAQAALRMPAICSDLLMQILAC